MNFSAFDSISHILVSFVLMGYTFLYWKQEKRRIKRDEEVQCFVVYMNVLII